MFKIIKPFFLIAETPIHAGSGSEVGIVDLPIQRERYTDFPKIESSGLKGCIREAFEFTNKEIQLKNNKIRPKDKIKFKKDNAEKETNYVSLIFGPEGEEAHAGALTITDARILLFPVKSLKGVFAWITCPMVLERFGKDLQMAGVKTDDFITNNFSNLVNTVSLQSALLISGKIVLEEFTFPVSKNGSTSKIAKFLSRSIFPQNAVYKFWMDKLSKDLVILSNDDFTQFVKTSTEIITRTRIDDNTGTVASGALWTEEYLPQDTILYSVAMFSSPRVEKDEQKGIFKADSPENEAKLISDFFETGLPEIIQIGGNQTIGKGFVRLNLFPIKEV